MGLFKKSSIQLSRESRDKAINIAIESLTDRINSSTDPEKIKAYALSITELSSAMYIAYHGTP